MDATLSSLTLFPLGWQHYLLGGAFIGAGVALLLPMLDVIPNAAIFIKDVQARYVLANRTLVQRCGLKDLRPLLGKTSAQVG